ncbi:platelet glycoprotein VI-like [Octodon degus]|uniref:Platelet glycoprotein VI-like n=1 Tax=Octodon degus TaxID=10160 RepID=A0A6P6DWG0_OCTDE|nr:platelet glycoprotein VI-like [Octodon degus]
MAPWLSPLLALGLCLGQEILAVEGLLPAPSISVEPGRVTLRGSTVTIVCRAQWGFESFRLEKCSSWSSCTGIQEVANAATSNSVAKFYLTLMNTGCYACIYQKWSTWSSRSEILELVVTSMNVTQNSTPPISTVPSGLCLGQEIFTAEGPLPAPSITAELGSMTSGGRIVTIVCRAQGSIERFRLEKCSADGCSAIMDHMSTLLFETEARFLLTLTNAGQYSCMYQNSSMWSSRSEILELAVTGGDVTQTVQSPTSTLPSDLSPASQPQDYMVENLVRMGLAGLILVALGILLLQTQCSQRRTQEAARP